MKKRETLASEVISCGNFVSSFLNCRVKPTNILKLFKECSRVMERLVGYVNTRWEELEITDTFQDLLRLAEPNFFDQFIRPYIWYSVIGGEDRIGYRSANKATKDKIQKLRETISLAPYSSWGTDNDRLRTHFFFYIAFAQERKRFRKLFVKLEEGFTLENLQNEPLTGELLLQLKSEYLELREQILIKGNSIKVVPELTDLSNITYSPSPFLRGYLLPTLAYSLIRLSEDGKTIKRVRRCNSCNSFFFARKKDRQFCHNKCSNKFFQKKLRKKRKWEEIEELSNKIGCTTKEAEEIIKLRPWVRKYEFEGFLVEDEEVTKTARDLYRIMQETGLNKNEAIKILEEEWIKT